MLASTSFGRFSVAWTPFALLVGALWFVLPRVWGGLVVLGSRLARRCVSDFPRTLGNPLVRFFVQVGFASIGGYSHPGPREGLHRA